MAFICIIPIVTNPGKGLVIKHIKFLDFRSHELSGAYTHVKLHLFYLVKFAF